MEESKIISILFTLVISLFVILIFSIEFNLINAFQNATFEGRELMYRQAIYGYNPQDKLLNLPLVRGATNEEHR